MHIMLYGLVALAGWGIGYALGMSWHTWVIAPCLAAAVVCALTLSKTPQFAKQGLFPAKSVAHRAWFSSSWATFLAILLVWWVVGWDLPHLTIKGIQLDPAGALGWTPEWLLPRQQLVVAFLLAGFVGILAAGLSWIWQKRSGQPPVVLALWALPPFFWMATLGLLIGITQPWRQAIDHEIAAQWDQGVADDKLGEVSHNALQKAKRDASAGVWAHALAVRAYSAGKFNKKELDQFMQTLAKYNQVRHAVPILSAPQKVGVEQLFLCESETKRKGSANPQTIKLCSQRPAGRAWSWSYRSKAG